jgi:hypothetical protein
LFGELARVLLWGWGGPLEERLASIPEDPDAFAIFTYNDAALAAAWRRHKSTLLKIWRQRGEVGQPWAAQQFDTN